MSSQRPKLEQLEQLRVCMCVCMCVYIYIINKAVLDYNTKYKMSMSY